MILFNRNSTFQEEYLLEPASIDRISDKLDELLRGYQVEQQNILRIRLSFEEALLQLRDRFGETQTVCLLVQNRFGRITLNLEAEGETFNPLSREEGEMADWSSSMLTAVGLSLQYDYSDGINTLRLVLPERPMNPILKILIGLAGGILLGFLGRAISNSFLDIEVTEAFFSWLQNIWYSILQSVAGPVIFLMVLTTIMNTRRIREIGGKGGQVSTRYLLYSILMACFGAVVSLLLFHPHIAFYKRLEELEYTLYLIGDIIPSNALDPFIRVSTPQILLMAFVIGTALNLIGKQAGILRKGVRQANMVGLLVTDWVSRLVPFFSCILIGFQIWTGNTALLAGVWKCALLAFAITVVILLVVLIYVGKKEHVSFFCLLKKLWKPFQITIRSGSLDTAFGQLEKSSIQELGIERKFLRAGLAHGLLLYMPISAIGTIVFLFYAFTFSDTPITPIYCVLAVVYSVLMFVATPPVPGANVLAYISVFSVFLIQNSVIVDAMVFDILFGFFASAANQMLLQLDLILQADKLGVLNKEYLCS